MIISPTMPPCQTAYTSSIPSDTSPSSSSCCYITQPSEAVSIKLNTIILRLQLAPCTSNSTTLNMSFTETHHQRNIILTAAGITDPNRHFELIINMNPSPVLLLSITGLLNDFIMESISPSPPLPQPRYDTKKR